MKKLFLLVLLPLLVSAPSGACTAFCYCRDQQALLAKNLDWPVDAGLILVNSPGILKSSFTMGGNAVTWTSRYGSVSFNQFGKEFPLGGMNSEGLVVEELNMPPVPHQPVCGKKSLNEFQLVQYLLDNFATVSEVEEALSAFQLNPLLLSLHYLLMDHEGRVRIMEYDGRAFVFRNPDKDGYPVLSNNPYTESLRYMKNFKGFGGKMNVQHRPGSNERFVSTAFMLSKTHTGSPVDRCFEILDTVSQPDTRWSLVYDATKLTIYLEFHACSQRQVIQLEEILSFPADLTHGVEVNKCQEMDPAVFSTIEKEENSDLMETVFTRLEGLMDLKHKGPLLRSMISYSNSYILEYTHKK